MCSVFMVYYVCFDKFLKYFIGRFQLLIDLVFKSQVTSRMCWDYLENEAKQNHYFHVISECLAKRQRLEGTITVTAIIRRFQLLENRNSSIFI